MARILTALERPTLKFTTHNVLVGPTLNVGLVRGGVAPNAVPADCEASVDVRYVPGQSAEGLRSEIQAIADQAIAAPGAFPGASVTVEIVNDAPPCEVSPDAPIVKRILRHAPDARVIGSGGGTFAKDLVLMGIDAVGWSPGDEETYHQPNEEIEIDQLVSFAGRLANLAFEITNDRQPGA
jgi:acetylornithine deacetylase/succinyl-diaminopimelate desuccinylase-like protein